MFWRSGAGKGKTENTLQSRKAEHDELILKIAQYVCLVSPGKSMKVLALGRSLETKSTSGEAGFQYQIKTDSGFGNLFIFPRFASIWMTDEPEPRHPLPMQMIEEDLKDPSKNLIKLVTDLRDWLAAEMQRRGQQH